MTQQTYRPQNHAAPSGNDIVETATEQAIGSNGEAYLDRQPQEEAAEVEEAKETGAEGIGEMKGVGANEVKDFEAPGKPGEIHAAKQDDMDMKAGTPPGADNTSDPKAGEKRKMKTAGPGAQVVVEEKDEQPDAKKQKANGKKAGRAKGSASTKEKGAAVGRWVKRPLKSPYSLTPCQDPSENSQPRCCLTWIYLYICRPCSVLPVLAQKPRKGYITARLSLARKVEKTFANLTSHSAEERFFCPF